MGTTPNSIDAVSIKDINDFPILFAIGSPFGFFLFVIVGESRWIASPYGLAMTVLYLITTFYNERFALSIAFSPVLLSFC